MKPLYALYLVSTSAFCAVALSGCTAPPEVAEVFNATLGRIIGYKLAGAPPSAPKDVAAIQPKEDPESPDNRALNAEFIREMYRVVLLRDVRSREEFDRFMNVLDQGGHYESVYNGVVYATEYREKEKGVAPVSTLKAYAEIMAQIALDQKYELDKAGASGDPTKQPTETERKLLVEKYERDAITKSTYALKRMLGEETLKTIDFKREYREKLATWYGRYTVFLNKRNVDFGIPLRNKADEYFHYKWALDADEDRLKWECLNRVHRALNATAGLREPVITPVAPAQQPVRPVSPQAQ